MNRPLTFVTGSRACGKSKLVELLCRLAHDNRIMCCIDTSDIIRRHIAKSTKIGIELSRYQKDMSDGKVIQAHNLIMEAILDAAEELWRACRTQQVIVAGAPRHIDQTRILLKIKEQHPIRVFHIHQSRESMIEGIRRRQNATGVTRSDENHNALDNAWTEYQEMIRPGLAPLNGEVLDLDRSRPMRERLQMVITHLKMPENVSTRMLRRLNCRDNPVASEVEDLDNS